MKIHKPTIISLAFLAAVYLVIQWRGNTASVEKNSQSSSETQSEATKSDKEKGVNEAETSSEDTTPEKADSKAVYTAYLTLLKERQKDIEAYTWQAYEEDKDGAPISVETKGIAIADVYGDNTPELLFIDAEENNGEGAAIRANLQLSGRKACRNCEEGKSGLSGRWRRRLRHFPDGKGQAPLS